MATYPWVRAWALACIAIPDDEADDRVMQAHAAGAPPDAVDYHDGRWWTFGEMPATTKRVLVAVAASAGIDTEG